MANEFVHLRIRSPYSLMEGMLPIDTAVSMAAEDGQPAIAVADDNLFGAIHLASAASGSGVQPISAQIFRISDWQNAEIVLYAKDDTGLSNLAQLSSRQFVDRVPGKQPFITVADLRQNGDGLICLTGGPRGPVDSFLATDKREMAEVALRVLRQIFGDRLYIEISRQFRDRTAAVERQLLDLAIAWELPIVATSESFFAKEDQVRAHEAVLALKAETTLSDPDRPRSTPLRRMLTSAEMAELFQDLPEAIENTVVIARRCASYLKPGKPVLPNPPGTTEDTLIQTLRDRAREGLERRLALRRANPDSEYFSKQDEKVYWDRLEYEVETISKMGFSGYFLIVSDFIRWAKSHDIPVGPGRGSGAGSLVAYSLEITNLDPLRYGLLFERFLNPDRVSMPDFDIDFCQDRRGEVIQYVRQTYGRDRVAQIATVGTLATKSAIREAGRVLSLPQWEINEISNMVPMVANLKNLEDAMDRNPDLMVRLSSREHPHLQELRDLVKQIEGLGKSFGTHAAGIVIGNAPLSNRYPLYRDPKSDMPATQYEMSWAEKAGLVKFDFLGLKTLSVIKMAVDSVNRHGGNLTPDTIPLNDRAALRLIAECRTLGVFQLESEGMKKALREINPDSIDDIIAVVALFRPGPLAFIPDYASRKRGDEPVELIHEDMRPVLQETYGIMVYQEQVMEIARVMAGYSLSQADLLRRAMGKKDKEEMDRQKAIFIKKAVETGKLDEKKSKQLFELIERFADYGFNKSHAAAYAVIAMQTAWLKAHHPAEFISAAMSYEIGGEPRVLQAFISEARGLKIPVLPPDINRSQVRFHVTDLPDNTPAIRYALSAIRGIGDLAHALVRARDGQDFASLDDFVTRIVRQKIHPTNAQLEALVSAGVFDSLQPNRAAALFDLTSMMKDAKSAKRSGTADLFGYQQQAIEDWTAGERMEREFKVIGFHLSKHPVEMFDDVLEKLGVVSIRDLPAVLNDMPKRICLAGLPVGLLERVSMKSGNKYAILKIGDQTGFYDIPVFSSTLQKAGHLLVGKAPLYFKINVKYENGRPSSFFVNEVTDLSVAALMVRRATQIAAPARRFAAA
jgi:DNA-directed DNA polymerase III (polc)